jgi:hypothetical protein
MGRRSGENVSGSTEWLEVEHGESTVFVHASLAAHPTTLAGQSVELVIMIVFAFVAIVGAGLTNSDRLMYVMKRMGGRRLDLLLYGTAIAGGALVGAVGFVLGAADGQTLFAFWSSAFTSLGAGLVAAGCVFVLFDRLAATRSSDMEHFTAEIAALRLAVKALSEQGYAPQRSPSRLAKMLRRAFAERGHGRRRRP